MADSMSGKIALGDVVGSYLQVPIGPDTTVPGAHMSTGKRERDSVRARERASERKREQRRTEMT
jgi:hypothetical protein